MYGDGEKSERKERQKDKLQRKIERKRKCHIYKRKALWLIFVQAETIFKLQK